MRGLEKNRMGRGQTNTQTNTPTCRLLDQLGPEGRFGEKGFIKVSKNTGGGDVKAGWKNSKQKQIFSRDGFPYTLIFFVNLIKIGGKDNVAIWWRGCFWVFLNAKARGKDKGAALQGQGKSCPS